MFVGQTYTTLPINVSIFGGELTSFSTGSPLLFSLEVAEGPRYTQDAGQFLVNPQLGELLAQPRLPGRVGLVLSARDYAGFSTIVYSREVVLLDRGFELDSSWRQANLQWPDRVTIQTTVTVDGPAEVGWSNDRLFQVSSCSYLSSSNMCADVHRLIVRLNAELFRGALCVGFSRRRAGKDVY
jgi:hypothetical protein